VFCGRAVFRGTETCAVVEAMASLELAFATFGHDSLHLNLMDRVERLAFNALPAALTDDMWGNVYVQQANSVVAGRTPPHSSAWAAAKRNANVKHTVTTSNANDPGEDLIPGPSQEVLRANFYGVSHYPCCIANFPQG
jgi:hypothetical protein